MKFKVLFIAFLLLSIGSNAQQSSNYQPSASNLKAREKFMDMKFGMFIHWGLYSILGDGEWVASPRMSIGKVTLIS